ncbi:MAG: alpha/beta fold hydrolase [Bacteroidales bacterium]
MKKRKKRKKQRWWKLLIIIIMLISALSFLSRHLFREDITQKEINNTFNNTNLPTPEIKNHKTAYHNIRYIISGNRDGPRILFIHGAPGSLKAYLNFFKDSTLVSKALLISVDRPGYGGSNEGTVFPSLTEQAQLIHSVLDKEKGGPIILAGHSLGGPISVKMAIDYPNQIEAMLLMAPSIDPRLESWKWYQRFAISKIGKLITPQSMYVAAKEIYFLKEQLIEMQENYSKIKAKTILIQGEKDRLVNMGNAYFAQEKFPSRSEIKIEFLPKEDHFIPWTQPKLVLENLNELIQEVK